MAALGQISNVYDDQPYQDFANLSNFQSSQSLISGDQAAKYADPFMGERANYQERLRNLIANPGSQDSSPFFKYLMNTQMKAVNASNAARGLTRSGRGAMALQDRAAGVATQSYFPQVAALTQLAQGGSSPAAAALSYERGVRASQDQRQMEAAARAAGQQRPPQIPTYTPPAATTPSAPATGYGLPYSGGSGLYGGISGQVDYDTPGYTPSVNAGTGYVISDYGASDVSGPGSQYYSFGSSSPTPDYGYSDNSGYGDYGGYGDYSDYGDYGGYDGYSDFGSY